MNTRYLTRSQYVAWCLARLLARVIFFGAVSFLFFFLLLTWLQTYAH
jgi:hypothetical protein